MPFVNGDYIPTRFQIVKPMTTIVHNLSTGKEYAYSLPPCDAVANAYAQEERKDFNTWDYGNKYISLCTFSEVQGREYVSIGDYVARIK
jgi:hypothetical protein